MKKMLVSSLVIALLSGCGQSEPPEPPNLSGVQLKKIYKELNEMNVTLKNLEAIQTQALQLQQSQYAAQVENNQHLVQMLNNK